MSSTFAQVTSGAHHERGFSRMDRTVGRLPIG